MKKLFKDWIKYSISVEKKHINKQYFKLLNDSLGNPTLNDYNWNITDEQL